MPQVLPLSIKIKLKRLAAEIPPEAYETKQNNVATASRKLSWFLFIRTISSLMSEKSSGLINVNGFFWLF